MSLEHYEHFCTVISKGPATGLQDTAEMVMALTAGQADPEEIAEWWACWQLLKQAMKDNHPMVKLAAAFAPVYLPAPVPEIRTGEDINQAMQMASDYLERAYGPAAKPLANQLRDASELKLVASDPSAN